MIFWSSENCLLIDPGIPASPWRENTQEEGGICECHCQGQWVDSVSAVRQSWCVLWDLRRFMFKQRCLRSSYPRNQTSEGIVACCGHCCRPVVVGISRSAV